MDIRVALVLVLLLLITVGFVAGGVLFIKDKGIQYVAEGRSSYYDSLDDSGQEELSRLIGVMMFFGALFCVVLWGYILFDNLS